MTVEQSIPPRHPCFPQPENLDSKVWRYLDLPKAISLFESRKLHFSRADLLGDPHEGSTTMVDRELRREMLAKVGGKDFDDEISRVIQRQVANNYINCWRIGGDESEAMWRLYCNLNQGVAIQTTYRKLYQCIAEEGIFMGLVTYIDYGKDQFPQDNGFYPFMHKRKAFAHETEVRLIKPFFDDDVLNRSNPCVTERRSLTGVYVSFDLDRGIESIYVNPCAPSWYFEVVRSVVRKFLPSQEGIVQWSPMKVEPFY